MSKVAVVTDSTAYIPKDLVEKYALTVTPQVLIWGDETLEDGVDIEPTAFYKRLKSAKVMPTTSQVSIVNMQKAFTELAGKGYDVIGIFISAKLSGTLQSAYKALELMGPAASRVAVIDSYATSMAMGFQVLTVARAAAEGAGLADCVHLAEQAREHTGVYFAVDTLEFLHRGGRIGGAQRFLGSALNLKPLLMLCEGRIEAVERIRTRGKALERMIELVGEQVKGRTPVRVGTLHANAAEEAREVLDKAAQELGAVESVFSELSPVVGSHAGPGTIGLAYMAGM